MKILLFAFTLTARSENALHALRQQCCQFLGKTFRLVRGEKIRPLRQKETRPPTNFDLLKAFGPMKILLFAFTLAARPEDALHTLRQCCQFLVKLFRQCCGSGSTCFCASWIRIRILLSFSKYSKDNLDFYCFVTFFYLLSLKNDVKVPVPSKSNMKFFFLFVFCWHFKGQWWK